VSGLYLYALVAPPAGDPSSHPLGPGLAGEPLRLLPCGPFAAVVGEPAALPPPNAGSLAAHDAVVRRLAERFAALLPARFGQALAGEAVLRERLAERERELRQALARVEGCVQMTLRVFAEDPRRAPPEPEPAGEEGAGPGTRYLAERLRALSLPEVAPLRQALRPLLRAERIERPSPPPAAARGSLVATAYDLVARADAAEYSKIVEEIAPRLTGYRVTATGPWPPYAFAPGMT
jgi:hypothetical protein